MNFSTDELSLIWIYNEETREGTLNALAAMREYLEPEDQELRDLTDTVMEKLERMTDAEFEALEPLYWLV